jgi:hypothetical protein
MKRLLLAILTLLPLSILLSQSQLIDSKTIDKRLSEVFEREYLDLIRREDPILFERWHFYLDHAFIISNSSNEKVDGLETYPPVLIADLSNINILKLEKEQDLKHDFYTETIYKIEGTSQFLVYLSGKDFLEKFNAHWKELKVIR